MVKLFAVFKMRQSVYNDPVKVLNTLLLTEKQKRQNLIKRKETKHNHAMHSIIKNVYFIIGKSSAVSKLLCLYCPIRGNVIEYNK